MELIHQRPFYLHMYIIYLLLTVIGLVLTTNILRSLNRLCNIVLQPLAAFCIVTLCSHSLQSL
jgi:hypothetical protein